MDRIAFHMSRRHRYHDSVAGTARRGVMVEWRKVYYNEKFGQDKFGH